MNFVFISPYFPPYFERFCESLKSKGVNVLGIGDANYDNLSEKLKNSLNEYYRVDNLENYEEVMRACGFFIHKYGRLDYIESLNEHWLLTEAKLRTDFNVKGTKFPEVMDFKRKSAMKNYFKQAGIPSSRYILATDLASAKEFVKTVGYPIVAKPDSGVGASDTFKISSDNELKKFFTSNYHDYLLEEYITGDIITFEGITNHECRLIFYASHFMLGQLMDTVNEDSHIAYYSEMDIKPELKKATEKLVKLYQLKDCFFHFEFFQLTKDKPGLAKKGDIVALEVNMRPPGGLITEVINHSYDIDIYNAWANTVAFNTIPDIISAKRHIAYVSRKNHIHYKHTNEEIYRKYGNSIVTKYDIEPIFRKAMGDYTYLIKSDNIPEIKDIVRYIQAEVK